MNRSRPKDSLDVPAREALGGRVLVAQTAYLGDLALTTALLRGLRLGLAPTRIDVLVGRSLEGLLDGSLYVDEVLRLDKQGTDRGIRGLTRAAARLRGHYDAALILVGSIRTSLCVMMAGIPWRAGFIGPISRFSMHRAVPYDRGLPHVERLASLVPEVDWPQIGYQTSLSVTEVEHRQAVELLQSRSLDPSRPIVALHPGSAWPTKRWPAERFGQVADVLRSRGLQTMVIGTTGDRELGAAVLHESKGFAANLCGLTSLGQLKALLAMSRLLVTNDSGPLHVAEALGTPVVAVFGSTTTSLGFAPRLANSTVVERPMSCRPCGNHGRNRCPLGHFHCMLHIPAAEVSDAVLGQLEGIV